MNLLALEHNDRALVQLTLAEEMRPDSANVQRLLARMALGDFDTNARNPHLAIEYARHAVALDPSTQNQALLRRSEDLFHSL